MEERRSDVFDPLPDRSHAAISWRTAEPQTPSPPLPTDFPRPVSAPPDLEVPEPLLLASSGIQPNWFSIVDIRADMDYESFYDAFKAQTKLPPPLDSSVLRGDFRTVQRVRSQNERREHVSMDAALEQAGHALAGLGGTGGASLTPHSLAASNRGYGEAMRFTDPHGGLLTTEHVAVSSHAALGKGPASPDQMLFPGSRASQMMAGSGAPAEVLRPVANAGALLRRDDSDASVENLIFRETLKYARQLDRESSESDLSTTAERRITGSATQTTNAAIYHEADRRLWQAPLVATTVLYSSTKPHPDTNDNALAQKAVGLAGTQDTDGTKNHAAATAAAASAPSHISDNSAGAGRIPSGGTGCEAGGRYEERSSPRSRNELAAGIQRGVPSRSQTPSMAAIAAVSPPVATITPGSCAATSVVPRIPVTTSTMGAQVAQTSTLMPAWTEAVAPVQSMENSGAFDIRDIRAPLPHPGAEHLPKKPWSTRGRPRRAPRNTARSSIYLGQHQAMPSQELPVGLDAAASGHQPHHPELVSFKSAALAASIPTNTAPDGALSDASAPLSCFAGRMALMARDQQGGRYLQARLDVKNAADTALIFEECRPHFVELAMDPFGNYLCQKLFEHCNREQRLELIRQSASQLAQVCMDPHGTRVVQKMIELTVEPEHAALIAQAISPHCLSLMCDVNGNHVIQRCLQRMDVPLRRFIYDTALTRYLEIARHRHGCCVLQRCLDHATAEQRSNLCALILNSAYELMQDPFGNYVVQYVLELKEPSYTRAIIQRIRGHLWQLSMQKFSSNVVEKVFTMANERDLRSLLHELLEGPQSVESMPLQVGSEQHQRNIRPLLFDPYANYVVQRALSLAPSPVFEALREAIQPHLAELRGTPFGKRIQARLSRTPLRTGSAVTSANGSKRL
jgi:hypothetical protein